MNTRVGGIAALAIGAGYIIVIPVFASVGAQPTGGGEAWLKYLSGHTAQWWIILGLNVVTDVLYIPAGLGLYTALRRFNQSAMLIAVALLALFVALDLAVTWSSYASLIGLSGDYSATNDAGTRAALAAAADYPSALLGSRLLAVYAIVTPGIGIGIIGTVMLRGVFNRATAYVGMATAAFAVLSLSGFFATVIIASLLTTAWFLLSGYRMVRLATIEEL